MVETDEKHASGGASNDLELIWGVKGIAKVINRSERQTYWLVEQGRLPVRKIGGRHCATRGGLRNFFAELLAGEVAGGDPA
jgi:hypothetical protein